MIGTVWELFAATAVAVTVVTTGLPWLMVWPVADVEQEQTASVQTFCETEQRQQIYTEEDVIALCKMVYGEARGTSDTQMAATVWCVINRLESDEPYFSGCNTLADVVKQPGQFHGYAAGNPVDPYIEQVVRDVLCRWTDEVYGAQDVGRVLPPEYLYFYGDGIRNHFTTDFRGGVEWDGTAEEA